MNPTLVNILVALKGAGLTLDSNGDYVVAKTDGTSVTYAASDVLEALSALSVFAQATINQLSNGANAAAVANFIAGVAPF